MTGGAAPARQRGAVKLLVVVIGAVLLAAAAMAALISVRSERNLFAEGAAALGKAADQSVKAAAAPSGGPMRKCVIHGKTVVSNTDCTDQNKTSKTIELRDSRGFEAPKLPPPPPAPPGADKIMDKMMEKQLQ
jgi:hypothetical protein